MNGYTLSLDSDEEIIAEWNSTGSNRAATSFVRKYQSFVYATAIRFINDPDDASDAAQETFIKALRNLKNFKGSSSLKTWLYRITVNVCSNMRRKKKFYSYFSAEDDEMINNIAGYDRDPEQRFVDNELYTGFLRALATLPEKQRETFALRYFEDMTYEEISQMLGTTVGGLKANYYQAVKKLTKFMLNK